MIAKMLAITQINRRAGLEIGCAHPTISTNDCNLDGKIFGKIIARHQFLDIKLTRIALIFCARDQQGLIDTANGADRMLLEGGG